MENPFELILEKLNGIEKAIAKLNTIEPIVSANHPMDIKDLSTYLKMSRSSIYKMTSSNDIPHYKSGRRLYFKKYEIDEWVFSNRIMRWSFEEYSKGKFTISYIRRMANLKGLICGRNNFWKVLHNPFYCGLVFVPAYKTEEEYFAEGLHEPLISEKLFKEVQCLLNSRRTTNSFKQKMKLVFLLRGFLICPFCGRRLTGSTSAGSYAKYQYYHCAVSKCKGRIGTDILDLEYEELLKKINIKPEVYELPELVLEGENILTVKQKCMNEQKKILKEISDQELLISKTRRHFIQNKIDFEDFNDLKKQRKRRYAKELGVVGTVIKQIRF